MSNLPIQDNTTLLNALLEKASSLPDANERFEAGKKAEYDAFWDAFQQNGERRAYHSAFRNWNTAIVRPKYRIAPIGDMSSCFMSLKGEYLNLAERLVECGVELDTSGVTNFSYAFYSDVLTRLPKIDTTGANSVDYLAVSSPYLETIDEVALREDGSQTFSHPFSWNQRLHNLKISGVIGNNFKIDGTAYLTHDSLMSIINCLKDYAGSGSTYTVTLGTTNLAKLTDAEKALATQKGWTLA